MYIFQSTVGSGVGVAVFTTLAVADGVGVGLTATSLGFLRKAKYVNPPANTTTKMASKITVAEPFWFA